MSNDSLELTDDNFETLIQQHPVALVDFYATWCGNCRMTLPLFKRLAAEAQVPLFKLDVEKNPKIKSMLSLEGLPTLGLFRQGEPVDAINATKEDALRQFFRTNSLLA